VGGVTFSPAPDELAPGRTPDAGDHLADPTGPEGPAGPDDPGGGGPKPPWWRRRAVILMAVVVLGVAAVGLHRWTRSGGDRPAAESGDAGVARPPAPATPDATVPEAPPTMVPPVSAQPTTTAVPAPSTTATPPTTVVEHPAPLRGTDYRLDFADDFTGPTPNPAVWVTAPFGNSLPATVSDGRMTLTTNQANEYRWAYIASTGPRSDGEPSYADPRAWQEGYFEARIRYTDNPWSWPAFWLFSMAKTEAWPGEDCSVLDAEWDIMENGTPHGKPARSSYNTTLHRNTSDGTDDGYCGSPDELRKFSRDFTGTDLSDWHVWSAHWDPDTFCTYLDGVEIQCMEPYDSTHQPMHLTFTMQYLGWCEGCPPRPPELEMQVDWVRVWRTP
jgi:hypothetical protein